LPELNFYISWPTNPTIAFITGGYSREAVISYESAKTIEKNLDQDRFGYSK
jgi:D-alanine-D-alanine ligase